MPKFKSQLRKLPLDLQNFTGFVFGSVPSFLDYCNDDVYVNQHSFNSQTSFDGVYHPVCQILHQTVVLQQVHSYGYTLLNLFFFLLVLSLFSTEIHVTNKVYVKK